jgi:hypothetical protein
MKTVTKLMIGMALVALLALPAMAVQPPHECDNSHPTGTCSVGESCGVTSYTAWGSWSDGECTSHGGISNTCEERCVSGSGSGCGTGYKAQHRIRTANYGCADIPGYCTSSADCDDKILCTNDVCSGNVCSHPAYTTHGSCVSDCQSGGGQTCTDDCKACGVECDTNDQCADNEVCTRHDCVALSCDDQDVCTTDAAVGHACQHTAIGCDDRDICTTDSCDSVDGCQHAAVVGCCIDNEDCDAGYECTDNECVHIIGYCTSNEQCSPWQTCTENRCTDKQYGCSLNLYEKNPQTWEIVQGTSAVMGFDASSFEITGSGLLPTTGYNIIYYPDPWPGTGLLILGETLTDGSGGIHTGGYFDFTQIPIAGDANPGAKIWVVLDSDVGSGQMVAWNPTEYLFENNLIRTEAGLCGGQPAPECYTDEGCPEHKACIEGVCVVQPFCGDDTCDVGETFENCPADCQECRSNADCPEGELCGDGGCYDPCSDVQCVPGFVCDMGQCVPRPRDSGTFAPYTEPECQAILNAVQPMDSIDPSTLPLLNLHDTYISAEFHYASEFDCVDLAYYTRGEPSFDKDCIEVEWWGREQTEMHTYGGMPVLTAPNPAGAICVLAVKNSQADTYMPVQIKLTDSFNNVGAVIVSKEPVIQQCYQLPEDFSECRLRSSYDPFLKWKD